MCKSIAGALLMARELRAGSMITEREISALKRRWAPHRAAQTKIDPQAEYNSIMEHGPFHITQEQAEKGIKWWRAQCFTRKGARRNTVFTRNNVNEHVWHVIETASRFELVDWSWTSNGYGFSWPIPVYRMFGADDAYFDYVAYSWQSGSSDDIVIN